MLESMQWLEKKTVQRTDKRNSGKAWIADLASLIYLWHEVENGIKNHKIVHYIRSLPIDKILYMNNLKVFADDKLNIGRVENTVGKGVENTVGKGENAGYQHFLLFP